MPHVVPSRLQGVSERPHESVRPVDTHCDLAMGAMRTDLHVIAARTVLAARGALVVRSCKKQDVHLSHVRVGCARTSHGSVMFFVFQYGDTPLIKCVGVCGLLVSENT